MWEHIVQLLEKNAFASGGLFLMLLGSCLAYFKHVPGHIWLWCRNQFLVTMDVPQHDASFYWVTKYLTDHPNFQKGRASILDCRWGDKGEYDLNLSPAVGKHFLWHKGWPIWFWRTRERLQFAWPTAYYDTFVFQTFGRNKKRLLKFINDARVVGESIGEGCVKAYINSGSDWHYRVLRGTKTINDVVLDGDLMERTVKDANEFMKSKDWYRLKGIPYRRGYLLYGPPGCGKSSLILALAGELKCAIYFLTLSDTDLSDKNLFLLISNLRPNSLLVIEDIDSATSNRETVVETDSSNSNDSNEKKSTINKITLSGLLNALDGILSGEGRLLIMTSNHPEKLDPALKRPGRTDVEVKLDLATCGQFSRMFDNFFSKDNPFVDTVKSRYVNQSLSPAQIQELFLKNKNSPELILL